MSTFRQNLKNFEKITETMTQSENQKLVLKIIVFQCFFSEFSICYKVSSENCQVLTPATNKNQSQTCLVENESFLICDQTNHHQKQARSFQSFHASNPRDVVSLLDNVDWKILVYLCPDNNSHANLAAYKHLLPCAPSSDRCGFTGDRVKLFDFVSHCGGDVHDTYLEEVGNIVWLPFLILGLVSMMGNMTIACRKATYLLCKAHQNKEKRAYHILVLNLAVSDFLMGFYIFTIAIDVKLKNLDGNFFTEIALCNFLGIINFLSSQVSLTTLVIISSYRLYGTLYPYKSVWLKAVYATIVFTWVVWGVITILPMINNEPFAMLFNWGIRRGRLFPDLNNSIYFRNQHQLFNQLQGLAIETKQDLHSVINAIFNNPSLEVYVKSLRKFGLVDVTFHSSSYFGYYSSQFLCSRTFLVEIDQKSKIFTIAIIAYDVMCSIFLLIAYTVIIFNLTNKVKLLKCFQPNKKGKSALSHRTSAQFATPNPGRSHENHLAFQKISFIIAVDLLCWLPLCFMSLTAWIIYRKSSKVCDYYYIYRRIQIAVFCIIPINSIVNPFVYSLHSWKQLYHTAKNRISVLTK